MSGQQKLPSRNHYVPQFYLRGFSQDKKNIFRFDKKTSKIKELPISAVGFQKNLYTYKTKDGKKDSLESVFSQIEGLASSLIKKLKQRQILSAQERANLSLFLSFQMVRTPAFQNEIISSQSKLMKKILKISLKMTPPKHIQDFLKKQGKKISIKEAENLIDFGTNEDRSTLNIDYPKEYWLKQMLQLAIDMSPVFEICHWEIKHSITPYGFLTSDHPFMLIPGEKPHPFYGVGLLTPKAKKIIPLTADMYLIAHEPDERPVIIHSESNKDFFRKVNKWTVGNAERYIFSPSKGKIEKIAKKNKELLITPKRYSVD